MQSCTLILPLIDNITTIVKLYLVALYITLRDGEREAIAQNGLRRSNRTKQLFEKTFGRGAMGYSTPAACDILLAFN
jgi:hypothetical protein